MKKILVVLAVAVAFGVGIYVIRSQQLSQHPGTNDLAEVNSTGTSVATDEQAGDELRSAKFGYEQLVRVVGSLTDEQREAVLAGLTNNGWVLGEGRDAITKTFKFANFIEAFGWMTRMAIIAEKMNHHPEGWNCDNRVEVTLTTHDVDGLSDLDVELAQKMDKAD